MLTGWLAGCRSSMRHGNICTRTINCEAGGGRLQVPPVGPVGQWTPFRQMHRLRVAVA